MLGQGADGADLFGLEADRFLFDRSFDSNYTWSRVTDETATDDWGRSLDRDGTPGGANRVLLDPIGSSLALDVFPQVSPHDGPNATLAPQYKPAVTYGRYKPPREQQSLDQCW